MRKLLLFLAGVALLASVAHAREGFGFSKKSITMNRTKPPALNTSARRIKVAAETFFRSPDVQPSPNVFDVDPGKQDSNATRESAKMAPERTDPLSSPT